MTITCAMSKGGAGKTTFARLVLGALASSGRKVAGLDCDPNRALTNWVESISKADIDIRHEVDETKIIPSAAEFEASHDLLIIDTAGTAAQATIFAIGCADLVIMPVQSSSDDVIEAVKTAELVKSAASMVKRKIPLRVVFTDYQPKTQVGKHTQREIANFGLKALDTKLHRLVAFKEMSFTGLLPMSGKAAEQVKSLMQELEALGVPEANEKDSVGFMI